MKYPYLAYSQKISIAPLIPNLEGEPFLLDLSFRNGLLNELDPRDQVYFQNLLDREMKPDHSWGLSGYLERRDSLLRDCLQMVEEKRFYHLGLDIIVPKETPLRAPLPAQVADVGYEEGEGNYGGFVMLKHESEHFETFYSFYGHLRLEGRAAVGDRLEAGQAFAQVGDFQENGNWFHHTHLQIITPAGLANGYQFKGYCSADDLAEMEDYCPSPLPLFRLE